MRMESDEGGEGGRQGESVLRVVGLKCLSSVLWWGSGNDDDLTKPGVGVERALVAMICACFSGSRITLPC